MEKEVKIIKLCTALILVVFSAGMVFAGGQQEAGEAAASGNAAEVEAVPEAQTLTVTDYLGREVEIPLPIERAVVFDDVMSVIITAIGAEEKVVGIGDSITDKKTLLPYLSSLPSIGKTGSVDIEKILTLEPDVVLMKYWRAEDVVEQLEGSVPVVTFRLGDPETYSENVKEIGKIFGREKDASDYIAWYEGKLEYVQKTIEGVKAEDRPNLFDFYGGEYGMVEGPPYGTFGSDNPIGNLVIPAAGANNMSSKISGDWITVDPEWVITENPEIIIREVYPQNVGNDVIGYETNDSSSLQQLWTGIMEDSALDSTEAVQNKRVYAVLGNLLEREWFLGIQYLAKWCYPDLFVDLEPASIHQEFLTRFLGIDYNVQEQGVFVYPAE